MLWVGHNSRRSMTAPGHNRKSVTATRMSAFGGKDAMRLKDAASCSFDCFNRAYPVITHTHNI